MASQDKSKTDQPQDTSSITFQVEDLSLSAHSPDNDPAWDGPLRNNTADTDAGNDDIKNEQASKDAVASNGQVGDDSANDDGTKDDAAIDELQKPPPPPPPPPPQQNFPFPLEIRQQIYRYLLHAQNVREGRYQDRPFNGRGPASDNSKRQESQAHTYHFELSILAVNKEIRKEALEVLQGNNFVLVSYHWSNIGVLKHQYDVPIVAENQYDVKKFDHHKLRVHIELPQEVQQAPKPLQAPGFVIVAGDLPKFCRFLQCCLFTKLSPASYISRPHDTAPHSFQMNNAPTDTNTNATTLKIRIWVLKAPNPTTVQALLEPFKNVIYGRMVARIFSPAAVNANYTQSILRRMGPKNIWTNAMAWHMLRTLRSVKQDADAFMMSGNTGAAVLRYRNIWRAYDYRTFLFFRYPAAVISDEARPLAILASFLALTAITDTMIHIRLADLDPTTANLKVQMIDHLLQRTKQMPQSVHHTAHPPYALAQWHRLICGFLTGHTSGALQTALYGMRTLAAGAILDQSTRNYVKHDLQLIDQFTNDPESREEYLEGHSSTLRGLCRSSAAARGDFIVFAVPNHNEQSPNGIKGYVDEDHYNQIRAHDAQAAAALLN